MTLDELALLAVIGYLAYQVAALERRADTAELFLNAHLLDHDREYQQ